MNVFNIKKVVHEALYEYTPSRKGDLTFAAGDELTVLEERDDGWWKVFNNRTQEAGYAPSNFIKRKIAKQNAPPEKPVLGVYEALYPYDGSVEGTLVFEKGARLEVLDKAGDIWWLARQVGGGGVEGFIPVGYLVEVEDVKSQGWFWRGTSKAHIDAVLTDVGNPPGTFLVRESESADGYALSVLGASQQVKHYLVRRDVAGNYFVRRGLAFRSVNEMVEYYKTNVSEELQMRLTKPCEHNGRSLDDNPTTGRTDGAKPGYKLRSWEIERSQVEIGHRLGGGNYGDVMKGTWRDIDVAVKSMKPDKMNVEEFQQEITALQSLHHPRLVKLYGVCTIPSTEPQLIITELVSGGSLLDHLKARNSGLMRQHSTKELVVMAKQVSSGMAYLEAEKMIHRDLAARNVLINEQLDIKIADLGLARVLKDDVYERSSSLQVPVRWTAPEALDEGIYTTKSDVWAYGILLFEIFTHGETPYPGLKNDIVKEQARKGKPMTAAKERCPDFIYQVQLKCWKVKPEKRPSFVELKKQMNDFQKKS